MNNQQIIVDASKPTSDPLSFLIGQVTRERARRVKEVLNGLVHDLVANQGAKDHSKASIVIINLTQIQECGKLGDLIVD